jgi:repressor LexA
MSRAPITGLSPTHLRIARAVARFERQQEPAFVPDLVRVLGLAAESSLAPTLRLMARNGYLTLQGGGAQGRSRLARLTAKGRHALSLGGLPLLGSIPAGPLSEALAEPEIVLDERELLAFRDGDFLLRVRGESMTGDGILDGDKVLLRPQVEPRDGEIAAVLVGDAHEATLKRVFRKGARVILRASHPAYPDVTVPAADVKVAGVFRGLIRDAGR